MRPFVSLVALAGLPGLLGGCFPPVPSAPLAEIASHPADRVPAAALVPGESLALVMAPSVTSLFTTLHRDALAEVFAEPFERARYELVQALRVDLLSLGGLVDLGIDPEGPVALGLLPGQAMVVAFELRRPDRLQTALYREGRRPRVVEGAVVVPLSDRVAAAVQGDHALVVVSEDAASAAERLFDATTPRLRDRPSFRRAMARLQGGGEGLTAYVDLRALLFMQLGLDPVAGRTPAAARVNLEAALREALRARATEGASAADLLAVERRFERRRARLRDDERARLLRHLLGDLDHAACSLVVHDADARLRVSLDLPAESPLRRVLAAAPEPGPLLAPLAARPALRAALGIDAAAVLEELEGLGEVIERPRWLAPWLRLAAPKGFALALAPPSESEAGSMPAAAMLVEVGDPAAVTTIFDAMVAKGTLDRDGEEVYRAPSPLGDLRLAVRGERLVVTNRAGDLHALLAAPTARASHHAFVVELRPGSLLHQPPLGEVDDPEALTSLSQEELEAERAELDAEIRALSRRRGVRELGDLSITVGEGPDHLVLDVGLTVPDRGLVATLDDLRRSLDQLQSGDVAHRERLRRRRAAVARELARRAEAPAPDREPPSAPR